MNDAEREILNSRNPDGTERELIMFGSRKVWVRRINPNRIDDLRDRIAQVMADESLDEALKSLEIMKIFLSEMKWKIVSEEEKTAYIPNGLGKMIPQEDRIYKIQCPGWVSSAHLRKDVDGRIVLILDVAMIAHMKQLLRDLKSVTDADIEKWNEGVKEVKRKSAAKRKARIEARKKSSDWVKSNTAVFSMAIAFGSLE